MSEPSEKPEQEVMAPQAKPAPQTALKDEKYQKLKLRFGALKKVSRDSSKKLP